MQRAPSLTGRRITPPPAEFWQQRLYTIHHRRQDHRLRSWIEPARCPSGLPPGRGRPPKSRIHLASEVSSKTVNGSVRPANPSRKTDCLIHLTINLSVLTGECKPRKPALCLTVKKDSPNKGKRFYTCQDNPKKCDFFLWFVSHTRLALPSQPTYEDTCLRQSQGGRSNEARARCPDAAQLQF